LLMPVATDREVFLCFLQQVLGPQLRPGGHCRDGPLNCPQRPSRDFSQTRSKGNRQDGVNQQSWEKVRKTIG
jgi:hypothetical protein